MTDAERKNLKQPLMVDTLDFLALPEVVKAHVCKFLDVGNLLNARLTCKGFKSVVEQATILERIPIRISSSKQLQKILESKVPFNNFVLNFKSLEEQTYLSEFAERHGAKIWNLNITTRGGHAKALDLLRRCSHLKELEIKTVNTFAYQRHGDTFELVLSNIRALRKLTIHELNSEGDTEHNEVAIFLKILNNCKHLEDFKIPAINSYNQKLITYQNRIFREEAEIVENVDEYDWEQETVQEEYDPLPDWDVRKSHDILIHPILDYIRLKSNNKNLPPVKRINVQSIALFVWTTFKDLLKYCYENEIRLLGIQSSQFVHLKNEMALLNQKYGRVVQSAHLTCIHHWFPLSMLENLTELMVFVNPGQNFAGLGENCDLNMPQLKNLRVQFIFSANDIQNQILIKKLFKDCQRPTVQRLQLEWFLHESCSTISARDLVNSMGFVRYLEISAWDAIDADFCLLWKNLMHLEKVTIKDCKNLTNKAFVGDFNLKDETNVDLRPLNRLKKLNSLIIRDISGNVNEVAIMGSFRWIKLRHFEFESTVLPAISEEVYRSLMVAPLGMYVEYFVAPRPYSYASIDKRAFTQGFKNLKRRVSW